MTGPGRAGPGVRDPGLQPERTRLAWRRTTLAFTVAGVLAVRQVLTGDRGGRAALALAAVVLVWAAFLVLAQRRLRLLGGGPVPVALSARNALGAAAAVVLLAALAPLMIL
ncbi:DUF202 domain-containing protein [Streptomyces clavuligerus]|uniref:DUF202 domain-containing protein n=1 Tax=Streptomyces clavuligerus TaxID=1901 RepID=E2PWF9_STRCL|nr:DUF202 domain-containing protein [Streptomyces clavuligerus]ANW20945.1 hypothetical protein BB341_23400 [Streptomyces clavuligerus]AXU15564.1 DUF202 domain-containing protein [Streptomyces clavuligerus]EFG05992.1 Hypothetical protein SCLAV_0915 [Streptomyces clavuligerus]MBY6305674.1 DUF202 domain-containing protein [Streptomyces clavuligerus]QCS08343.1 DUF202 domain-containing protein [Streptomyces clavuligerus]